MPSEMKEFSSFERMVKNLAEKHIRSLKNVDIRSNDQQIPSEIGEVTKKMEIIKQYTSSKNYTDIKNWIEEMMKCSENVFKPSKDHYYIPQSEPVREVEERKHVPVVYDLLLNIFLDSTQLERQYHFHELLRSYHKHFNELFKNNCGVEGLSQRKIEEQVKIYLPYVKLAILKFCKDDESSNKSKILESISEIIEVILYPRILREECYEIINNKVRDKDYEFLKFELNFLEERPGFLGDYYKLNIFIRYHGADDIIRCFVKCMPTTNETTKTVAIPSFFKEIFFYNEFIPTVNSLGAESLTNFLPECYLSKQGDHIVLEDLSFLNYKTSSLSSPMQYEWLVLVIKQLAKLHSCSLIHEEKMSQKTGTKYRLDDVYRPYLDEYFITESKIEGTVICVGAKTTVSYLLDAFVEDSADFSNIGLKEKTTKAFSRMFKDVIGSKVHRNVICHGDLWGNNILFKNNKYNKPESCRLIDFQIIRYCHPSLDLIFFLFLNTNKATRDKYFNELLDLYYTELKSILERFDINVDDIYDHGTFLEACDYYKLSAICLALTYIQIVFIPKEIIKEMNENPEKSTIFYTNDRTDVLDEALKYDSFKCKIQDAIDDLLIELKK